VSDHARRRTTDPSRRPASAPTVDPPPLSAPPAISASSSTASLALTVLLLAACGGIQEPAATGGDDDRPAREVAIPIEAVEVGPGAITERLEARGRLEERRRERIVALAAGIVAELPIDDGDRVAEGAVLARLQALPEEEEELIRARRAHARAVREYERLVAVRERAPQAVSGRELDNARDDVEDAEGQLAVLERRRERRVIRAPIGGLVAGLAAIPGQRLQVGETLCELLDTAAFRLDLELPETSLARLAEGQEVAVEPLAGESTHGTVTRLPRLIDPETGTGTVAIAIADPPPDWRPGAYATARCVLRRIEADLVIPRHCVHYRRNRSFAWRVHDHEGILVVRKAWIDLGAGDAERVAVAGGLEEGDRVVARGAVGMRDWTRVEIAEPGKIRDAEGAESTEDAE